MRIVATGVLDEGSTRRTGQGLLPHLSRAMHTHMIWTGEADGLIIKCGMKAVASAFVADGMCKQDTRIDSDHGPQ